LRSSVTPPAPLKSPLAQPLPAQPSSESPESDKEDDSDDLIMLELD
jgi:hypothetical protein